MNRLQEVIQQALYHGGIVEHLTDPRGLRGFLDEIFQARGRRVEILEEKRINGRKARGKLRGMHVPTLVETEFQAAADMFELQLPTELNGRAVLIDLPCSETAAVLGGAVRWNGKYVQRTVGNPDTGSRKRHLYYLARKIGRRMSAGLARRRDAQRGRVIVRAEVRRHAAPPRRCHQRQQVGFAALVENGLRSLNHYLDSKRAGLEIEHRFQARADISECRDLVRKGDLRQRNAEMVWQCAPRFRGKFRQKKIERADASFA